ncbi:MAG: nucleotidyltransferase family protein [Methylococcales bacterium]
MKAMILAAGRGERLRPLTDLCPKPLLPIAGKPMIEHTINALVENDITEIIINLSYKGEQIRKSLGDGKRLGARLSYSDEGAEALETAGGIRRALDFFDEQAFLVVNGDIYTDFPYAELSNRLTSGTYLVLVTNPSHHPQGDFGLDDGLVTEQSDQLFTFSGIGVYNKQLFEHLTNGRYPLAPLLYEAIRSGTVTGELYLGVWVDVGNLQRYEAINQWLNSGKSHTLR